MPKCSLLSSSDVIFYNTKISTQHSTTWIFKFLIVINHLIIVAMIALKYLDLLQGVKFLFSNVSIMTYTGCPGRF